MGKTLILSKKFDKSRLFGESVYEFKRRAALSCEISAANKIYNDDSDLILIQLLDNAKYSIIHEYVDGVKIYFNSEIKFGRKYIMIRDLEEFGIFITSSMKNRNKLTIKGYIMIDNSDMKEYRKSIIETIKSNFEGV